MNIFFFSSADEMFGMRRIVESDMKICSISDDDDDILGLNKQVTVEQSKIRFADSSASAAACIELTSPNADTLDALASLPLQRPNKLMRNREPVHQTKAKDADMMLMETSLMILDASTAQSDGAAKPSTSPMPSTSYAYHSSSSFPAAMPSTSGLQANSSNQIPLQSFIHSALSPPPTSHPSKSQAINQASTTSLIMVQPAIPSTSSGSVLEPELVLSPAKLGQ